MNLERDRPVDLYGGARPTLWAAVWLEGESDKFCWRWFISRSALADWSSV